MKDPDEEQTVEVGYLDAEIVTARKRTIPGRKVRGLKKAKEAQLPVSVKGNILPLVFFSSLTGSTEKYATSVADDIRRSLHSQTSHILDPQVYDLSYVDYDDFFVTTPKISTSTKSTQCFYILLVPSYNIDTVLNTFLEHLKDTHHDFRIDTAPLSKLAGYSVFGFGDKEGWKTQEAGYCAQALELDRWMAKLTG